MHFSKMLIQLFIKLSSTGAFELATFLTAVYFNMLHFNIYMKAKFGKKKNLGLFAWRLEHQFYSYLLSQR